MSAYLQDVFNLAELVLEVARSDPDRVAVIEPARREAGGQRGYRRFDYRTLSREVEAVALGFREIGIAECTRTVFMAPPSFEACVAAVALTRVGATPIWIDPSVGFRNVAERLRRTEPEAFVGTALAHTARLIFGWGARSMRRAVVLGEQCFLGAYPLAGLRRTSSAPPRAPAIGPDDPAAVLFTTGSTGPAKAALYRHRDFVHVHRLLQQSWRLDSARPVVDMPVFPAFFFVALGAGGTVVVPPIDFARESPARADPRALIETINDCGVRSMFGSPVLLENLARHAFAHRLKTPTLERIIGGGAPIEASVMAQLSAMVGPGGEVYSNYGATEALPTTELSAAEMVGETAQRTTQGAGVCVGRPFAGVSLRIVQIADGPVETLAQTKQLAAGEIGEILVRGPHVSPCYFRDSENTQRHKIRDADGFWHRLGDAGYLDAEGRLWVCGRVSQKVQTRDGVVFSLECEPIVNTHPNVRRSALVSLLQAGAELPVLCVELEPSAGERDRAVLRAEITGLAQRHPRARHLEHVLFHPGFPMDPRHNSKIERPALAKWAATQLPQ